MFAAAVAMTMPTVEIAIFSTGRRASSKLLEQIAELVLNNNLEWADRVAKNKQESFWLKHAADNGVTSLAKVRCR